MNNFIRCPWCISNALLQNYHDNEWGVPLHDDKKHFEFILLEVFQCGLNWKMMLQKRDVFRKCFDNFDFKKIADYNENKINEILNIPDMIKSRKKIEAIINNAKCFIDIINEYSSFDNYIWGFTNFKTYIYKRHIINGEIPDKNELSDQISKNLKMRGFKYLGSITIYSHLQASGIICDHLNECWKYNEIVKKYPVEYK